MNSIFKTILTIVVIGLAAYGGLKLLSPMMHGGECCKAKKEAPADASIKVPGGKMEVNVDKE